jgi:SAM-dependent methyltransferase
VSEPEEKPWSAPNWIRAQKSDMQRLFSLFYRHNIWGGGSGAGSAPANVRPYMHFLQTFLHEKKIQRVLDLGCGDWQFARYIDWTGIDYTGVDVVPSVIEQDQKQFARDHLCFVCADVTAYELPEADLVTIKDVLQHWSNETVLKFLPKLQKYRYVLFVNGFQAENADCETGDTRPLNLQAPPFNLPVNCVLSFAAKKVYLMENH